MHLSPGKNRMPLISYAEKQEKIMAGGHTTPGDNLFTYLPLQYIKHFVPQGVGLGALYGWQIV